jgi:hypothetical protein
VNATAYQALRETLISPNESDRNWEPANVVDGLFAIMRAIRWHDETYALGLIAEFGTPEQRVEALVRLAQRTGSG